MVPVGVILPFYGNNQQLPADFLFCDGNPITKTAFPELYSHLALANTGLILDAERALLPDLRGEFIRGWANDRDIDKDRKLGSLQLDMFKAHHHQFSGWVQITRPNAGDGFHSVGGGPDINVQDPPTTDVGGNETRPRNVAVNFIIRARP
ncbi:MAG TPA: tail fiber protein [Thermoanaerobaculia bacterium]|nr:tail fiber protein [Thermoanaerobaculia bacterium]